MSHTVFGGMLNLLDQLLTSLSAAEFIRCLYFLFCLFEHKANSHSSLLTKPSSKAVVQ